MKTEKVHTVKLFLIFATIIVTSVASAEEKLPVPPQDKQTEAEALVRDIFKADYANATAPAEKFELAKKLLEQGLATKDDPVGRYVLLGDARDLAVEVGSVGIALDAIEAVSEQFEVDSKPMIIERLVKAAKVTKPVAGNKQDLHRVMEIIEEAVERDDFGNAMALAAVASFVAKNADGDFTKLVTVRVSEIESVQKAFVAVRVARQKLETAADNPEANLIDGRYLCFLKGDWDAGLKRLTKCSDVTLKALAEKDLANATTASDQVVVGDGWWNIAEKEEGLAKARLALRAKEWYSKSEAGLTGLTAAKVKKRLQGLAIMLEGTSVATGKGLFRSELQQTPTPQTRDGHSPTKEYQQSIGQVVSLPRKPSSNDLAAARSLIATRFKSELEKVKTSPEKHALAHKLLSHAQSKIEPETERYASFVWSRELFLQADDVFAASEVNNILAKSFQTDVLDEQSRLLEAASKRTKSLPSHRAIAIIAINLAAEAAGVEQYVLAKNLCEKSSGSAKIAGMPATVLRSKSDGVKYEALFTRYKRAVEARKQLETEPNQPTANALLGDYECWVQRKWATGLQRLRHTDDQALNSLVIRDLDAPDDGENQQKLAEEWLLYAQKQKNAVNKASAGSRAVHWFELSARPLPDTEQLRFKQLHLAANEIAAERAFSTILGKPANGMGFAGEYDCTANAHQLGINDGFDIRHSWILSMDAKIPNFSGGQHFLFFWGDAAIGEDPITLLMAGNMMHVAVNFEGIGCALPADVLDKWVEVCVVYDEAAGVLELYVDRKLAGRRIHGVILGRPRAMPVFLGGEASPNSRRWSGKIKSLWLGNIH